MSTAEALLIVAPLVAVLVIVGLGELFAQRWRR